jgi:hypothetical protein
LCLALATNGLAHARDDLANQTVPDQAHRRDFVDANVMSAVGRLVSIDIERR